MGTVLATQSAPVGKAERVSVGACYSSAEDKDRGGGGRREEGKEREGEGPRSCVPNKRGELALS